MSNEKLDYGAIVADLEAKKAALESAIASFRMAAASGALGSADGLIAGTGMPFSASGTGEVPDGAFHGKTIPEAIKLYLSLMHKKQTARQISDGLKKGGMESTSRWFDKIIYATLDRLRKAGEVVKIEGQWGLPEWYPALMRAGVVTNGSTGGTARKIKMRTRKYAARAKKHKSVESPPQASKVPTGVKTRGSNSGAGAKITRFLRDNPGTHSFDEIKAASGIENLNVATMLLGRLVKGGKAEKTGDGKYCAAN